MKIQLQFLSLFVYVRTPAPTGCAHTFVPQGRGTVTSKWWWSGCLGWTSTWGEGGGLKRMALEFVPLPSILLKFYSQVHERCQGTEHGVWYVRQRIVCQVTAFIKRRRQSNASFSRLCALTQFVSSSQHECATSRSCVQLGFLLLSLASTLCAGATYSFTSAVRDWKISKGRLLKPLSIISLTSKMVVRNKHAYKQFGAGVLQWCVVTGLDESTTLGVWCIYRYTFFGFCTFPSSSIVHKIWRAK